MPTLPDFTALGARPTPPPAAEGVATYRPTTGLEEVPSSNMQEAGGQLGQASQVLLGWQKQLDETNAQDVLSNGFAPKFRAMQQQYMSLQGKDAVEQLPVYAKQMEDLRNQVGDALPNPNQKIIFNNEARMRVERNLDMMAQHANTQNQVWQAGVARSGQQDDLQTVADSPFDHNALQNALEPGIARIYNYAKQHGGMWVDGLSPEAAVKNFASDALSTKIKGMAETNPIAALAEIKNPETAQYINPKVLPLLTNQIQERATVAQTSAVGNGWVDDALANIHTDRMTRAANPQSNADIAINALLPREGGYVASDGNSGAPANFGINQKANPDIDVKNLTQAQAIQLYKDRYVSKINGFNDLSPAAAIVALDTAALQGPGVANQVLASTGGDPNAMIAARRQQLQALAARDPTQQPQLAGWMARLDNLQAQVQSLPSDHSIPAGLARVLPDTSGLPDSKDVRAQLPLLLGKVQPWLDANYGTDQTNPDRIRAGTALTNAISSRVNSEVAQLNAVQTQAYDGLVNEVAGLGRVDGTGAQPQPFTNASQIATSPTAMRNFQLLPATSKEAILTLIQRQSAQAAAATDKGTDDPQTVMSLKARVGDTDNPLTKTEIIEAANAGLLSTKTAHGMIYNVGQIDAETAAVTRKFEQQFALHKELITKGFAAQADPEGTAKKLVQIHDDALNTLIAAQKNKEPIGPYLTSGNPKYVLSPSVMAPVTSPSAAKQTIADQANQQRQTALANVAVPDLQAQLARMQAEEKAGAVSTANTQRMQQIKDQITSLQNPGALVLDGYKFPDQQRLDAYKAAKAAGGRTAAGTIGGVQ